MKLPAQKPRPEKGVRGERQAEGLFPGAGPAVADALGNPGIFALLFSAVFLLHARLLRLPYFWDEAGYYIPAARDLLLRHQWAPTSTLSSGHPPLVLAYLAAWWKLSGYTPPVTRTAMLLISAFALLGVFRLARRAANTEVALAATICTALYPVFFTQSSMAHLDMAATALTLWTLIMYLQRRPYMAAMFATLAALSKETAIITPLSLFLWELVCPLLDRKVKSREGLCFHRHRSFYRSAIYLLPAIPLAAWFAYHYARTGYMFGNPEFFRYNVMSTLHPLRIAMAAVTRLWQLVGHMNLFVLTLSAALALRYPALPQETLPEETPIGQKDLDGRDGDAWPHGHERPRIDLPIQLVFAAVILGHLILFSAIGGAVLARYLLPVVPLVIILCVSTLRRRIPWWPAVIVIVCLGFAIGLVVNPPYGFAPEDNLAFADYVRLHKSAADFVEARHPNGRVLTAWPASDELTRAYLGYVSRPVPVLRIENFSAGEIISAARMNSGGGAPFEAALLFPTKYEAPPGLLMRFPWWERVQTRFFGYHRDLPPQVAANILGGRIVFSAARAGHWVAVVEIERAQYAKNSALSLLH